MTYPIHAAVLYAAHTLFRPGDVVELRIPNAGKLRTVSGYFDEFEKLAAAAATLEHGRHPGVYWTLNPVDPALLARAEKNRAHPYAKATSADENILTRRWLPIDFDPKRPSGISSTQEEKAAALSLAESSRQTLTETDGWPEPVYADSGNGAHLLYAIDLPNDASSRDLLIAVLKALAARFASPAVDIDLTMFNAARICKVYGTTARKGASTEERPHRVSSLLHVPSAMIPVSLEQLRALVTSLPSEEPRRPQQQQHPFHGGNTPQLTLPEFLSRHGLSHRKPASFNGGTKYVLDRCPFDPSHEAPDSMVFEMPSGAFGFKCLHNSCSGRDWQELREKFEGPKPAWNPRHSQHQQQPSSPAPAPEASAEEPVNAVDVEAAIDTAIEAKDLVAALRLVPEIAKLRPMERVVIKAKLKLGFGRDFSGADFDAALRDATSGDEAGQKSRGTLPQEEGDGYGDGGDGEDVDGSLGGPDLRPYPLTDAGNGERLVALHGKDIRYCTEMNRWLVWDGVRWVVDVQNVMRQKVKEVARLLYYQAAKEMSEVRRKALEVHARNSESAKSISNALTLAATEPGVPLSALQLDLHPMLFNVPNGVIDLRTGKLLPHCRDFLISKLCSVKYDPAAKCDKFLGFLEWAMGHSGANPEAELSERTAHLVGFVQRALGYSLTGQVGERCIFVCYGGGSNGKSTLLTVFRQMMGEDYAGELLVETLMAQKSTDATARADIADLRGLRFAQTSEVEKEHRLREGQLKYLTAGMGTKVKSRKLYENPIDFIGTHHVWMDCNYRPEVRGTDIAIWKRLKCIPFEMTIEEHEKDIELPVKLATEHAGVLAWAVRGCLEWQKNGLGEPPEVTQAGTLWRETDDPLRDFLEECTTEGEGLFVGARDLGIAYEIWCKDARVRPIEGRNFAERLRAKKYSKTVQDEYSSGKRKQFRCWSGLELQGEWLGRVRKSDRVSGMSEGEE